VVATTTVNGCVGSAVVRMLTRQNREEKPVCVDDTRNVCVAVVHRIAWKSVLPSGVV
jgi:hypothetical protein